MKQDVANALESVAPGADPSTLEAAYRFDPSLPLFQGHFPGRPMVPGAMEIEMVRHAVEALTRRPYSIVRITKAKFSAELLPGKPVTLHATMSPAQDEAHPKPLTNVRAVIRQQGKEASRISVVLCGEAKP